MQTLHKRRMVLVMCRHLQTHQGEPVAGEPGLEVCAGKGTNPKEAMRSGLWVPCDPVPGAITVNIGDALQYWSDGRLKSTFHRVRMPRKDEYQVTSGKSALRHMRTKHEVAPCRQPVTYSYSRLS